VANVDRYTLPTDFRKFEFLRVQGAEQQETNLLNLSNSHNKYVVHLDTSEYQFRNIPTSASTAYTLSNSETAASSVTIELDTVDGLAAGEEIWVDGTTTDEFTIIQSVDTDNTTITAKLANNQSASDKLYRVKDIVYFAYYKTVTALSSDTDTPATPDSVDLIIPHYAAYLYYQDQRNEQAAVRHLNVWDTELKDAWLAFDRTSVGESNQFTL
jgi:hypothetical protein